MKEPLLKLENIAVGYNGRPLYSEVNDSVESGSLVAFLGENGAGKSTLLRSIAGRLKPLAGDVKIAGTDIAGLSRREMALTVSIVATGNTLAPRTLGRFRRLNIRSTSFIHRRPACLTYRLRSPRTPLSRPRGQFRPRLPRLSSTINPKLTDKKMPDTRLPQLSVQATGVYYMSIPRRNQRIVWLFRGK